jgi:endogenous inhibitor of DNA gyrase (YacG/DUF329 family)
MKNRCPVCKVITSEKKYKSQIFPFCSERCRLIDLGKWLDAEYMIISKSQEKTVNDEKGE